jgi:two-component system, OmpR family, response regulator
MIAQNVEHLVKLPLKNEPPMRVLLVEDEESVVEALKAIFAEQNFVVDIATNGEDGWQLVDGYPYDLVVLDVMLPKLDGITFCRRLRAKKNSVLVLMLTARDTTTDKLLGLDAGADDYVVKPFNLQELSARIRALLRRNRTHAIADVLECGGFRLDATTRETNYRGQPLQFSRKELLILELLMRNPQQVFSRSLIVDRLWAYNEDPPNEDTIKSHVKTIRRKLGIAGASDLIETLYGQGYRINPAFVNHPYTALAESPLEVMQSTVADIWERTKGASLERIATLSDSMQLLATGTLDEESFLRAIQSAHKLAGSLGTFGFDEESQQARQIELGLQDQHETGKTIAPSQQRLLAQQLQPAMAKLQHILVESSPQTYPQRAKHDPAPMTDFWGRAEPAQPASQPVHLTYHDPAPMTDFWGRAEPAQPASQPVHLTYPVKILAIDDDRQILLLLEEILRPHQVELTGLSHSSLFWDTLDTVQPSLLVLDISMPDTDGLSLCRAVRSEPRWSWLPIVVLTAQRDRAVMHQAFAYGADDFVEKPIMPDELITRLLNRLKRSQHLRNYTQIDSPTGIANRAWATQCMEQWLQLALQSHQPICFAWLELDPTENESFGVSTAEQNNRLRHFGEFLHRTFCTSELVARWSAQEFVVVLYGTTRDDGVDRIAQSLENWRSQDVLQSESFSAGVVQFPLDGTHLQMLYRTAEAALHWAKHGRDRVLPSGWQPLRDSSQLAVDVLLVCADTTFRQTLERSLNRRGYHTHWLSDAQAAVEALKGKVPALKTRVVVLVDDSPDHSLTEVLQQLGKRFLMQVRTLAWLTNPDLTVTVQALGAFDYLLLPCDRSAALQHIRRALQF